MFSDTFAFGFPPRPWALAAHCALLNEATPGAPWMIAGLGVDIRPLIGEAVGRGGHVRVGLEDAPFGCTSTNVALIEEAVRLARAAGGEPATVAEMREELSASAASCFVP
jgi:3-keto-5-aminohexanoate cleavage enzyme